MRSDAVKQTRLKRLLRRLAILAVLIAAYFWWAASDRTPDPAPLDLRLKSVIEIGKGHSSIIAIQPYMNPGDYASEARFQRKLDGYLREANKRGWLTDNCVVALPEYLGAWLVVAGEKRGVYNARTTDDAMRLVVLSNVFSVARNAISVPCQDRLRYAVFRMKAEAMARIYDRVLSHLARRYRVTIIGGSTVLPSPRVVNGHLEAGFGQLYNVAPVYLPNGSASPNLVVKTYLTEDEKPWLSAGKVDRLPVFDTPAGRIGVLICADSWFPRPYEVLKRKGARTVVVSSYIVGDHSMNAKWPGYSGQKPPSDVRTADIGHITRGQAWARYALPGRIECSGIPAGVMVCLRAKLWDLGSDGSTVSCTDDAATCAPVVDGAAIVRVRLSGSPP